MGNAQPSDAELLARLRSGDDAACAAFHERHARPVHLLATTYPHAGCPDDLVRAAFERLRRADAPEAGPGMPCRARLFVALRAVAADRLVAAHTTSHALEPVPEGLRGEPGDDVDAPERAVVLAAFAALPDRMQAVLWQTEVEGRPPGALAPVLGMTVDATAALALRARELLRRSYLRARVHASPRPGCEPHRSRLDAYLRAGDRARTATAAHVDRCAPCQALVAEVAGVTGLFARAIAPWFAPPAGARGTTGRWARRPLRVLAGARRRGWQAAAAARGDPALTGTVAVAVALVAALLSAALFAGRPPADVASPAPLPADATDPVTGAPATGRAAGSVAVPATGVPSPAVRTPTSPAAAAAPAAAAPAPAPDDTGDPPKPAPRQAAPPPAAPPPAPAGGGVPVPAEPPAADDAVGAAGVPSVPSLSSAVWVPATSQVYVTLVNGATSSTGFLVVSVAASDGALVGGTPTGCALALALPTSGMCALAPLASGAQAVVHVPLTVTRPGQTAVVQVCAVAFLRLECATPLLAPTVVALA